MTLEEQVKELEVKLQTADAAFASMKTAIADKDVVIAELQKASAEAVDRNKSLDKELTILKTQQKAAAESSQASSIMDGILKDSVISESLHPKIKAMLNYDDFRTEAGDFNADAFTVAFKAEVKDWEAKLPLAGSLGVSEPKQDIDNRDVKYSHARSEFAEALGLRKQ